MREEIILLGGGGHCKSCIDVIEQEGRFRIVGILDLPEKVGGQILGYEIIGTDNDLISYIKKVKNYLITVGQIKSVVKRIELWKMVKEARGNLPVIISPISYVAKSANIDEGTIIMHHALINVNAKIGKNCIINSKALIEHDAVIGDDCHISTSAVINGGVVVGRRSFIGSNAIIRQNISLPENSLIQANSFIKK